MMNTKIIPSWFVAVRKYLAGSRHIIIGLVFILAALFVQLILAKPLDANLNTTFTTNINDRALQIPNWVFNSKIALEVIASLLAAIGFFQIIKRLKKIPI